MGFVMSKKVMALKRVLNRLKIEVENYANMSQEEIELMDSKHQDELKNLKEEMFIIELLIIEEKLIKRK